VVGDQLRGERAYRVEGRQVQLAYLGVAVDPAGDLLTGGGVADGEHDMGAAPGQFGGGDEAEA
jgi:hypothetical protein